jgi:tetratricopeptide (TPR) repeat protein
MLARIGSQPLLDTWLLQAEGIFFNRDGDHAAAVRAWTAARDAKIKLLGMDHPDVGMAGLGLGNMLQEAGRYEEALAIDASTAEMLSRSLGNDHPWVARVLNNEGEVLNILRRHGEARRVFERCVDIWTKTGAPASLLAYGQTGLGVAFVGEGKGVEAVAPLEHALASRETAGEPAEVLGETRFALARALWTQSRTRPRALTLARQARADYAQAKIEATVTAIDAWLAAPGAKLPAAAVGPI